MSRKKFANLLFDLDGTLVDPFQGITGSYKALLKEMGLDNPGDEVLRSFIGPPLRECLARIMQTNDSATIEHGVLRYRHYYVNEKFMLLDPLYPDVEFTLMRLRNQGRRLLVATSKAESYARDILAHHKLDRLFDEVYGSELDGTRSNKKELIAHLLKEQSLSAADCLMIGDRKHDALGAKANGVACVGVEYGYGSYAELSEAGVLALCPKIGALPEMIRNFEAQ